MSDAYFTLGVLFVFATFAATITSNEMLEGKVKRPVLSLFINFIMVTLSALLWPLAILVIGYLLRKQGKSKKVTGIDIVKMQKAREHKGHEQKTNGI